MFKFKNGRVWFGKLSFVFPEGFYFDNDAEETYFNGFSFLSPRGFYLEIRVTEVVESIYKDLEGECKAEGSLCESEITPVKLDSLQGYAAYYRYGWGAAEERYYEAHYQLPDGGQLIILVRMSKLQTKDNPNLTIQNIMKLKAVKDFLKNVHYGIQREKA